MLVLGCLGIVATAPSRVHAGTEVEGDAFVGTTLLQVGLETGRTHQIRVHLSAIGHPIVGDTTYGGRRARIAADLRPVLSLERPFLHAHRLVFTHPTDGRRMEFESPLPEDLQTVLNAIEALQPED